jgi:uncharacterized protein (DUF2267 family)
VKQEEMVATVAERAAVSRRHADDIIMATLTALGERLTADETKDLLAQLPKKYKQNVNAVPTPNLMSADEFVARVAELEGERSPTLDDARVHVRAVLGTVAEAVNTGELNDVIGQLSADFGELIGTDVDEADEAQEEVAAAFDALERDVTETFDAMREQVDEAFDAVQEPSTRPMSAAGELGREQARGVVDALTAILDGVARNATAVATGARDRALDLAVIAVDGIEAVTDRLDDAAEALQEAVHRKAEAVRS